MLKNLFSKQPEAAQDIELLPTGDWHIGSTVGLHPNVRRNKNGKYVPLTELGGWFYTDRPNFYPYALQVKIWNHFDKCLEDVAARRRNKKLIVMDMADKIDGDHHNTSQLTTVHISEQTNTAIETTNYMKDKLNYQAGDEYYCLQGTNVHVGIEENGIGKQIGAYEYEDGVFAAPFLELIRNGVTIWAYHQGVSAGQGVNRGNACIRKMKEVYYQCLQDNVSIPDIIITAHTHDAHHATWTRPDGKTMHYLITAPFQDKTRFAQDKLATNKNKVGMQTVTITAAGVIVVNPPMLMASPLGYKI